MRKIKQPKDELITLLSLDASEEEVKILREIEINVKNPTRMTVIAASLYKKAAAGDLSAIKELLSIVGSEIQGSKGGVTLVDDIGKS